MYEKDKRAEHLAWVEAALRRKHPDLLHLRIAAQSHYGPPVRIAFVEVRGIDGDCTRRRQIRAAACELLQQIGYRVEMEPGRDVYHVEPVRPESAHDELRMLQSLRAARGVSWSGG